MGITAQGARAFGIREDVSGLWRLWRCRMAGLISPIKGIPVVAPGGPARPRCSTGARHDVHRTEKNGPLSAAHLTCQSL
jgi:hypothetical protein